MVRRRVLIVIAALLLVIACRSSVAPGPRIHAFTAAPTQIVQGQSSTLHWTVTGAASLAIDECGDVTGLESIEVRPLHSATYYLRAQTGALEDRAEVTVAVEPMRPKPRSATGG